MPAKQHFLTIQLQTCSNWKPHQQRRQPLHWRFAQDIPISSQNSSPTYTLTLNPIYYCIADIFQTENMHTHCYRTILRILKQKQKRRLNGFALTHIYCYANLLMKTEVQENRAESTIRQTNWYQTHCNYLPGLKYTSVKENPSTSEKRLASSLLTCAHS